VSESFPVDERHRSDTYIDLNLLVVERQIGSRKMLPDLGGMHAIVVSDSSDVKWSTVCFPSTLHGRRTELLEIQLTSVRDPSYRAGIADQNFELVELISKLSF
jgi:hypothetical protein